MLDLDHDAGSLWLAAALCPQPLSLDVLVALEAWRPGTLWSFLDRARREGVLVEAAGGAGFFAWREPAQRRERVLQAQPAEWRSLLARAPLVAAALAEARRAIAAGDHALARPIYEALARAEDRAAFPGGEAGWVAVIVESIRLFRSMHRVTPALMDQALAVAEGLGDLKAQAVLLASKGLTVLGRDLAGAHALYARAEEAAEAVGAPELRAEVQTYIGVSYIVTGRYAQGVAAFERLLGDVPDDVFNERQIAALELQGVTPGAVFSLLSMAYVSLGQAPRGLDLLHRMLAFAQRAGSERLEAESRLFLGVAYVQAGDPASARPHAEKALAYWGQGAGEPMYGWFAASTMACVLAAEQRLQEACTVLEAGLAQRRAAGNPTLGGRNPLTLLELLEIEGITPPADYRLAHELERLLRGMHVHQRGLALWYRARQRLRAAPADFAAVRPEFDAAVACLREAGALPDLAEALEGLARVAREQGDRAAADAYAARAHEVAEQVAPRDPGDERGRMRLATAVLELGRLASLATRSEGLWGEITARLCRDLGAERCALVATAPRLRLLATRGGGAGWQQEVLARAQAGAPEGVAFTGLDPVAGMAPGQRIEISFQAEGLGRGGLLVLENRHSAPRVGPEDRPLLEALGVQLGILMGNVALWRELTEARRRLEAENRYYRESAPARGNGGRFVGDSPALRRTLELVARVAPSTAPVLVTGETGVGKELVAGEVHRLSPRAGGPFIAVHVASLPSGLVASGLFGHERGAFSGATEQVRGRFELADGGTLFLDEVGELSLEDQVRLLRVLQEGTFERVGGNRPIRSDFRLVTATNRDLAAEVRAGRFREDLYYRLSALPVTVPPLRERREEIPTLALYFMERSSRARGLRFEGIPEPDMARLLAYRWPGNVRELEHVIERATLLSEPPGLRIPALEADGRGAIPGGGIAAPAPAEPEPLLSLEEAERRHVRRVLFHTGGRITGAGGAAEILDMKPSTLQSRIDKLGLRGALAEARAAGG